MISLVISNSSDIPLYRQIIDQFRRGILEGEISPGEALPSIRALAADLSISVITTKRAYDELEAEGLLETIPGRGCFAAGSNQMLRERRMKLLEELLSDVIKQAEYLEIPLNELTAMIKILKEEENGIGS
jgi:GntR family transcriptional regulator